MSQSDNLTTDPIHPPPTSTPLKSSIPSHQHVIDPDILLDRLGLVELEPSLVPHHPSHNSHTPTSTFTDTIDAPHSTHGLKTLSTFPERMSEESLDDNHAFTDITPNLRHSRNVHNHGGYDGQDSMSSAVLEPLKEVEEESAEDNPSSQQYKSKNQLLHDAESYTAPLHLNVLRMSDVRLQGLGSTLISLSSRSSSRSRTSRDISPSPQRGDPHPIDPDILLDRLGLVELEPSSFHHPSHVDPSTTTTATTTSSMILGINTIASSSVPAPLQSLPERMSEETLEDCHAFTEFKHVLRTRLGSFTSSQGESGTTTPTTSGSCGNLVGLLPGTQTRDGSVSGGSILGDASLLETLEEFEEEDEEEEEKDHPGEENSPKMKKRFGKKSHGETSSLDIIEEKESDL